jgi:hypothetical protein
MAITVTSGAALVKAVRNAGEFGYTKIIIDAEEITLPDRVILPKKLKCSSKQLIIEGNGCTINAGAPMPYMIGREAPVDANEANNIMQSQGFDIVNMKLNGKGLAETGIYSRCTFHDLVERVTVASTTKHGIVMEFAMNCEVRRCETANIPGVGIWLKNGAEWGGGYNKSGANMGDVVKSRSFPKHGQTACFKSDASGNTAFKRCTVDAAKYKDAAGVEHPAVPKIGWDINNDNSTTCKNVKVTDFWAESLCETALIKLSLSGGYAVISGAFPQYAGVMVMAEGTNYSEVHIDHFGNVHGSAKFHAVDADTVWKFSDNPVSFDFSNPANWIGGVLPGKYFIEGFIYNKEYAYKAVGAVKLNGKNLLTQQ